MKGAADCMSARCGLDAGCRKESDGSFVCICTHDLSVARLGQPCPRRVVNETSRKKTFVSIHRNSTNQQHPVTNSSNIRRISDRWPNNGIGLLESNDKSSTVLITWVVFFTSLVAIVGVVLCICLLRRVRMYRMISRNSRARRFGRIKSSEECLITVKFSSTARNSKSLCLLREWIDLEEQIGQGHFGQVFRGQLRRPESALTQDSSYINMNNGQTVAIKIVKNDPGSSFTMAQAELFKEAEITASLSHENILAFRGIVFNESNMGSWMVYEYMELGDLAQLLRSANEFIDGKPTNFLSEQDNLYSAAKQIANGMTYLSSKHFVHRDLACRNCLVGELPSSCRRRNSSRSSNFIVKISDLGMSRALDENDYYKAGMSHKLLPVRWMSPESILHGKFTSESDVWSYGVVLWEIYSMGAIPFYGHTNEQVIQMIPNGERLKPPVSTPLLIYQIMIEGCWQNAPSARISFSNIYDRFLEECPPLTNLEDTCVDYLEFLSDTDIDHV